MSLKMTPAEFGVKFILELRQQDNPNITVYRTEFNTKPEAINEAIKMHRDHVENNNDIYHYLLYKVWLVGAVRVVDKKFERLGFSVDTTRKRG